MVVYVNTKNINPVANLDDTIKLLKAKGHTRISYIGIQGGGCNSDLFRSTLSDNGIHSTANYYAESDYLSENSGYETMEYLLAMPCTPTAVISEFDIMASGAEKYIISKGLRVPQDISVIGLESFSGKKADRKKLCKHATEIIVEKIQNRH